MTITSREFLYLCTAVIIGIVIAWSITFVSLRNQPNVLTALLSDGLFLRLVTVVFIVCGAFGLAIMGKFSGEVTSIFSAVAGFVLGGVQKSKNKSVD